MRYLTGLLLVAVLAGCGGSHKADPTLAFRSTTQTAFQSAAAVQPHNPAGERQAAMAWRGFAVTVQGMDAGKDRVMQGQLVALANQAADAYAADVATFECVTENTINSGPVQPCPPKPVSRPDGYVAQIRSLIEGL